MTQKKTRTIQVIKRGQLREAPAPTAKEPKRRVISGPMARLVNTKADAIRMLGGSE